VATRRLGCGLAPVEALADHLVGVVAGPPGVDRVDRGEPGVEHRGEAPLGGGRDRGELHARLLGQVDQVHPLAAGVQHRREPAMAGPPAGQQQLAGVGQLVHGAYPQHPVGVEQPLPGAVLAGQGAGVGGDHGPRPASPLAMALPRSSWY
jgi:hypothetical protein